MIEEIYLKTNLSDVVDKIEADNDIEVNLHEIDSILGNHEIESDVNIITEVYNINTTKAPDIGMLEFLKLTAALTGIPLKEYLVNYCKRNSADIDMSLFTKDEEDEIKSILLEIETDTHTGKLELGIDEIEELDLSSLSMDDIEAAIEETLIELDLDENENPPEVIEVQFKKFGNRKFKYRIEASPSFIELPNKVNTNINNNEEQHIEDIHHIRVTNTGKIIEDSGKEQPKDNKNSIDEVFNEIENISQHTNVENKEEQTEANTTNSNIEVEDIITQESHINIEDITEEIKPTLENVDNSEKEATEYFTEVKIESLNNTDEEHLEPNSNPSNTEASPKEISETLYEGEPEPLIQENVEEQLTEVSKVACEELSFNEPREIEVCEADKQEASKIEIEDDILKNVVVKGLNSLTEEFNCDIENNIEDDISKTPINGYTGNIYKLED